MRQATQYRWNQGKVAYRAIAGESVLIPIASEVGNLNSFFQMNPSATLVWEQATSGADAEQIAAALADAFEVDPATALADTRELLDTLVDLGALLPVGAE